MNKKWTAKWSRWLHIYLSMFSFLIVLFFSVTGFTLNHADYFQKSVTKEYKGYVDSNWIKATDTLQVKKFEISEFFRTKYKVRGSITDYRIDNNEISFSYKGPGYEASIFIDRQDAQFQLTETNQGLMGFMNDLHKGRDTTKNWLWIIDASAIFMILISITGLILLLFLKKRRNTGLLVLGAGFLIMIYIYALW
ncbi:MAG: hypothetical protein RL596_1331 [Bacteroidota bacterium]